MMFMTPMPLKWRDTAIRGHRDRGAGILDNETYIGRLVFNCRNFRKNPETDNREARMSDMSEWVVGEAPELRIVSDELWAKVKKRQLAVEASFSHTTTNRLNRAHRPQYLLSGLLECDHCCGPYPSCCAVLRRALRGRCRQSANRDFRRILTFSFQSSAEPSAPLLGR
ncbi:recombinase family protein [Agrobacterium sp. ST15.16.055]|nr:MULTISPECIES: recombinase family protein [Agrobacterium]MDA5630848.1 recombinase family protein [Agrobacterium sp. ST15.16.055]MDA6981679.1 recombinase family protein [Agrobacterium salinitolerans]